MLTGKNRTSFNNFLRYDSGCWSYLEKGQNFTKYDYFYDLPISMQFGVVQGYADSIGYRVDVLSETTFDIGTLYGYNISKVETKSVVYYPYTNTFYDEIDRVFGFVDYDEARKAAIKAFDDIVNAE
jgi:hypothetical protein